MTKTPMTTRTALRAAASAAALAVMTFTLAACGGASDDGEYIGISNESLQNYAIITIDGDDFSAQWFKCDETPETPDDDDPYRATGSLNDDHTSITWIDGFTTSNFDTLAHGEDNVDGNGTSVVSFDGDTLTIGEGSYVKRDSSQGEAIEARACES